MHRSEFAGIPSLADSAAIGRALRVGARRIARRSSAGSNRMAFRSIASTRMGWSSISPEPPRKFAKRFHTEVHNLVLPNGEKHIANMSDPQIPAALAPAIEGVASLA